MLLFKMPTALQIDGLRVVIYPNDHRPPHVHVLGAGTEAVFILNCPAGPPTLRGSFGFTTPPTARLTDHKLLSESGKSLHEVILETEKAVMHSDEKQIFAHLDLVLKTMEDGVNQGLDEEGHLPGSI